MQLLACLISFLLFSCFLRLYQLLGWLERVSELYLKQAPTFVFLNSLCGSINATSVAEFYLCEINDASITWKLKDYYILQGDRKKQIGGQVWLGWNYSLLVDRLFALFLVLLILCRAFLNLFLLLRAFAWRLTTSHCLIIFYIISSRFVKVSYSYF